MSDRADFLAGIAASGCGSPFGIHGDFGTFSDPYPDPSPPGKVLDSFDYDMSDDYYPFGGEDYLDADSYTLRAPETNKPNKPALKRKRKAAHAKRISKIKKSSTKKKKPNSPMIHRHLDQDLTKITLLSEDLRENLARMARKAREEFGECTEKKFEHLEWAGAILTPSAYTYYVHIVGVDKEMQRQLSHLERKDQPVDESAVKEESVDEDIHFELVCRLAVKDEPGEKQLIKKDPVDEISIKNEPVDEISNFEELVYDIPIGNERVEEQSNTETHDVFPIKEELLGIVTHKLAKQGRKQKKKALLRRPLSKLPFNATERRLVEGLLSLLMRVSESFARQPWPKVPKWSEELRANLVERRARRLKMQIRRQAKAAERFLNGLRKLIEKNWSHEVGARTARMPVQNLIEKVRCLDKEVLGIPLLPSTECIHRIVKIIDATYLVESRSADDNHCIMPAHLIREFDKNLCMRDVYDAWRATYPPDSERLSDFMTQDLAENVIRR